MFKSKRNWKQYWAGYLSHWLTGALLGVLALHEPAIAAMGLAIILTYQALEYLKYHDTPALDIADYGVGFALGVAGVKAWHYLI